MSTVRLTEDFDDMEDEKEGFISSICATKYFNFDNDGKPCGCVLDPEKLSEEFDTPEKLWEGFVKEYVKEIAIEFAKYLKMKKVKKHANKFFENM